MRKAASDHRLLVSPQLGEGMGRLTRIVMRAAPVPVSIWMRPWPRLAWGKGMPSGVSMRAAKP